MPAHARNDSWLRIARLGSVVACCLVLASCGIGGDDDEEPTPTEAASGQLESQQQPTGQADSPPGTPEERFVLIPPSPEVAERGPAEANATANSGTPDGTGPSPGNVSEATAESVTSNADGTPTIAETPVATSTLPANAVTGSDGTSGAGGSELLLAEAEGTPVTTPEAASVSDVDDCDVVDAPPFGGEDSAFVASEEVNFRVGPGADCESLLDAPLDVGTAVTVLSDPVVRTDDAERVLWVQVEIDGEIGWIAADFIEPAG